MAAIDGESMQAQVFYGVGHKNALSRRNSQKARCYVLWQADRPHMPAVHRALLIRLAIRVWKAVKDAIPGFERKEQMFKSSQVCMVTASFQWQVSRMDKHQSSLGMRHNFA